jgi:predicted LPLAT superfamily acyltransferase
MNPRDLPLWRRAPERGSLTLMRTLAAFARLFGRRAAGAWLMPICAYFVVCSPRARRASRDYQARVRGAAGLGDVFRHFRAFATTLLDRVFWRTEGLDRYAIGLDGVDAVLGALGEGRGALLLGAHFGSFELAQVVARAHSSIVVDVLMHPDNAQKFGAVMRGIDAELDLRVIVLGQPDTMLRVRDALAAGHLVGLLADRSLRDDDFVREEFLGAPAAFPRGPFKLAAALGVPVLYFYAVWRGGRRYAVRFERAGAVARDVDGAGLAEARVAPGDGGTRGAEIAERESRLCRERRCRDERRAGDQRDACAQSHVTSPGDPRARRSPRNRRS